MKVGLNQYSDTIKEVSVRKNFSQTKSLQMPDDRSFLYCDPQEVILQSTKINILDNIE